MREGVLTKQQQRTMTLSLFGCHVALGDVAPAKTPIHLIPLWRGTVCACCGGCGCEWWMRVAAVGDGDGGGREMRVVVVKWGWRWWEREGWWWWLKKKMIVCWRPNRASAFADARFGRRVGSEGNGGRYIALISLCNKVQHGAGGYCEFLAMWLHPSGPEFNPRGCNFFFNSKDPITLLYWCETQFCSASLSVTQHIHSFQWFSAEYTDQCWALWSAPNRSEWAIAEPLSSQFGWGKRKADADQRWSEQCPCWSEHVGESKDLASMNIESSWLWTPSSSKITACTFTNLPGFITQPMMYDDPKMSSTQKHPIATSCCFLIHKGENTSKP